LALIRKEERKMDNIRITVRLPEHQIKTIDLFIRMGEFTTRSEVIRHALNDFIERYSDKITAKVEKIKKVQELEAAVSAIESYVKK